MSVDITVFAGQTVNATPIELGDLVSLGGTLINWATIEAAADAYAEGLILAPQLKAGWSVTLTVDVAADSPDLERIRDIIVARNVDRAWRLNCGGTVDVAFTARTVDAYPLSSSADVVRYMIELAIQTDAELSGGDIVTAMLDFRSRFNTINWFFF